MPSARLYTREEYSYNGKDSVQQCHALEAMMHNFTCPRSLKFRMFMVWPRSRDMRAPNPGAPAVRSQWVNRLKAAYLRTRYERGRENITG